MTRTWLCGAVLVVAGCGRIDFSARPLADASSAAGDAQDASGDGDMQPYVCPTGVRRCDTFDAATLSSAWQANGNVTLDTTTWYRGGRSLRFAMPATQAMTANAVYIGNTDAWVASASQLWVRGFFRITALPPSTNALELINVEQTSGVGDYVFLRSNNTEVYTELDMQGAGNGMTPPLDTWFCLVWHVAFATTANGTMSLTSDVLPPVMLTGITTQGSPPVDVLEIGPFYAPINADVAQAAFDVWLDDLILDDVGPLTCAD